MKGILQLLRLFSLLFFCVWLCICKPMFVSVCRSVKGSVMAYEARCVSTGDMRLGEERKKSPPNPCFNICPEDTQSTQTSRVQTFLTLYPSKLNNPVSGIAALRGCPGVRAGQETTPAEQRRTSEIRRVVLFKQLDRRSLNGGARSGSGPRSRPIQTRTASQNRGL